MSWGPVSNRGGGQNLGDTLRYSEFIRFKFQYIYANVQSDMGYVHERVSRSMYHVAKYTFYLILNYLLVSPSYKVLRRCISCYLLMIIVVPDVSLPMDEVIDNVVQGSITGTMTFGATLVSAQFSHGLYTDGKTGHVNYGNHYTECYHIPDMCVQGVTFALWIKRGGGTGSGIVLYTGGYEYDSKGMKINIPLEIKHWNANIQVDRQGPLLLTSINFNSSMDI